MQVLLLDWLRRKAEHLRQLRLLRSELRNALQYGKKFNWTPQGPNDLVVPRPPRVTANFESVVSGIDFELTDEHSDDNTQQVLLGITANFEFLQDYVDKWYEVSSQIEREHDPQMKQKLLDRGIAYMHEYDGRVDEAMFSVHDALRDVERRIAEAGFWRQVRRAGRRLPTGENPPPLLPNDPRVTDLLLARESPPSNRSASD